MLDLTLKQLRYVEALARHGHFGRAAAACAISQPALSVQIKELEETLGAPLFERGPRMVRPTGFGEDVLTRVRAILREVEALGDFARAAASGGRLRLGVIPTVAPYLLPGILAHLSVRRPDLDLHVRETLTARLMDELASGQIDAAIVALPVDLPGIEELELLTEPLVLVRPATHADAPAPDADALRAMRVLLLEEGHCFRDHALAFCNLRPAGGPGGLDGSSLGTLVQMVGAGIGVTLIPQMAVAVETRSADVAVTRFPPPEPARTIGMVWRRTSPLAALYREIADAVVAAAA